MKYILIALTLLAAPAFASEGAATPTGTWSFDGLRAGWNKAELYRGYTVATQVCMSCHSFKYINHRDLMRAGFTEAEVKAMAKALNMELNAPLLSGLAPADAQETYGKVPPDLSMMNKAREEGADYVHAILTGYSEDPALISETLPAGLPAGAYFNKAFPGHAIAMPPPLQEGAVTFADGTPATVEEMSHDVAVFLQWTAEPERFERQRLGVFVLIYLAIFTLLAYVTKRAIWKDVH